ncbi:MAG: tripartite tricarboxylate transporter TctB family protein [Bacillota bacterium]
MEMWKRDRIVAIFMLVLSGLAYYGSRSFSEMAQIFPAYIIYVLAILSLLLLLKTFNKDNYKHIEQEVDQKTGEVKEVIEKAEVVTIDQEGKKRVLITVLATIAYIYLMNYLGFFVTTYCFMFVLFTLLKVNNLMVKIFVPLFTSAFVFLIFRVFLTVPTPKGIFF